MGTATRRIQCYTGPCKCMIHNRTYTYVYIEGMWGRRDDGVVAHRCIVPLPNYLHVYNIHITILTCHNSRFKSVGYILHATIPFCCYRPSPILLLLPQQSHLYHLQQVRQHCLIEHYLFTSLVLLQVQTAQESIFQHASVQWLHYHTVVVMVIFLMMYVMNLA